MRKAATLLKTECGYSGSFNCFQADNNVKDPLNEFIKSNDELLNSRTLNKFN